MSRIKSTRPGHWAAQRPFVMPTAEEIAAADEIHDMRRANRWMPVLFPMVPLVIAAVVLFLLRG